MNHLERIIIIKLSEEMTHYLESEDSHLGESSWLIGFKRFKDSFARWYNPSYEAISSINQALRGIPHHALIMYNGDFEINLD